MSIEERILFLSESPDCNHPRELRAIALEVRKREDRIKQLEEAGDALYEAWLGYGFTDKHLAAWLKAKEAEL